MSKATNQILRHKEMTRDANTGKTNEAIDIGVNVLRGHLPLVEFSW